MSMKWYDGIKNTDDVVISSRVRLARNLENFPFPSKLDREGSEKVALSVKEALENNFGKGADEKESIEITAAQTDTLITAKSNSFIIKCSVEPTRKGP